MADSDNTAKNIQASIGPIVASLRAGLEGVSHEIGYLKEIGMKSLRESISQKVQSNSILKGGNVLLNNIISNNKKSSLDSIKKQDSSLKSLGEAFVTSSKGSVEAIKKQDSSLKSLGEAFVTSSKGSVEAIKKQSKTLQTSLKDLGEKVIDKPKSEGKQPPPPTPPTKSSVEAINEQSKTLQTSLKDLGEKVIDKPATVVIDKPKSEGKPPPLPTRRTKTSRSFKQVSKKLASKKKDGVSLSKKMINVKNATQEKALKKSNLTAKLHLETVRKGLKLEEAARRDEDLDRKEREAEAGKKSLFEKIMDKKEELDKGGGGFWSMLIAGGVGAIINFVSEGVQHYLKALKKILNFTLLKKGSLDWAKKLFDIKNYKWLQTLSTKAAEFGTKFGTKVGGWFKAASDALTKVGQGFSKFKGFSLKSLPIIKGFIAAGDELKKLKLFGDVSIFKGGKIAEYITKFQGLIKNISKGFQLGLKVGGILGRVVGKLFAPIMILIGTFKGITAAFTTFNKTTGNLWEKTWAAAKAGLGKFVDVIFGWIPSSLSWIAKTLGFTKVAELINSVSINPLVWIETIVTFFKEVGTLLGMLDYKSMYTTIKDAVLGFVTDAWDWIVDGVKKFFAMSPVSLISGAITGNDALQNIQREVLKNVIPDPNQKHDTYSKEGLFLKVIPDSVLEFVWGKKMTASEGAAARGSKTAGDLKKIAAESKNPEAIKIAEEIAKLEADKQKFSQKSVTLLKASTEESMKLWGRGDAEADVLGQQSDQAQRKANNASLLLKQRKEELNLLLNGQSSADRLIPGKMDKTSRVDAVSQVLSESGAMNAAPVVNVVNNNGGNVTNNTSQSTQNTIAETNDQILSGSGFAW